ncbi:MAG: sulfurtransferase [Thermoanaerobaculia bacterium]
MRKLALTLMIVLTLPLAARTVRKGMLVSTDWLDRHLGLVTVLHVGDRESYDAGHIPGAVFVDLATLVVQRDAIPNELPPVAALEEVFRTAGVGTRDRIVVYGVNPLASARAWFTLDSLGQGQRVSLLDGGLPKWKADACPLSYEDAVIRRGTFTAAMVPETVMHLATMRELVRLRQQVGANLALLDARPTSQFTEHIPGAVNVPFTKNFAADGTLHPARDLWALYESVGVSRGSANIAYCRTGMQACVTYFVLRYLGCDAALYDGSWSEWSAAQAGLGGR